MSFTPAQQNVINKAHQYLTGELPAETLKALDEINPHYTDASTIIELVLNVAYRRNECYGSTEKRMAWKEERKQELIDLMRLYVSKQQAG